MSLKNYRIIESIFSKNKLENEFTLNESLVLAEDISLCENVPQRIMDELMESYSEEESLKLVSDIKESFKGVFNEENINEGARPKKLTGAKKVAKESKSALMSLANKDEKLASMKTNFKNKYVKRLKSIGKKNGINVKKVNFDKIKL